MMIEEERRKAFWLLKKYTSYTMWKAVGDAYAKFVSAWERAVKLESQSEVTEFETEALKDFWDGQRGFDKGLPLLKRGERSVFRYRASGYLGWHAASAMDHAQRLMDPVEYVFDWMKNKDEVIQAWSKVESTPCMAGSGNEPGYDEEPAAFGNKTILDEEFYGPFNFPSSLPDVPPPTDITVQTGEPMPADGIWEPEWTMRWEAKGLTDPLVNMIGGEKRERIDKGCMNYLLADTIAPTYQDGLGEPEISVRWRLIWEDTRYRDGIIPEEEAQYLAPASSPSPQPVNDRLRAKHGELVPRSGLWSTPALQGEAGFRHFRQGERFPDQTFSEWGEIIWNYDPERQPKE